MQLDYDPSQISYEELLEIFWNGHNPTRGSWSRQYMAAVFYHNEGQKRLALASKAEQAAKKGQISTEIIPATEFYLAEDYHQKYMLRYSSELLDEFRAIYPNPKDFVNSTATARVNGYMSGYGDLAQLQSEIDSLGLSAKGSQRLLESVQRYHR